MGRTKKELDSQAQKRKVKLRKETGLTGEGNLLPESHTMHRYMWFIFHNLLKTLDKDEMILLTVCYS